MQDFKVSSQSPMPKSGDNVKAPSMAFADYLKQWSWCEAKYPKARGIEKGTQQLLSIVQQLDEEARIKSSQFNEVKAAAANIAKKETANLASRDLMDLFTPSVVQEGDFIQTESLTTLVIILPKAGVEAFLKTYETYSENVVPRSAKCFDRLTEEDGTQVWRIVLFKSAVDAFMKKAREERVATCRAFTYDAAA